MGFWRPGGPLSSVTGAGLYKLRKKIFRQKHPFLTVLCRKVKKSYKKLDTPKISPGETYTPKSLRYPIKPIVGLL